MEYAMLRTMPIGGFGSLQVRFTRQILFVLMFVFLVLSSASYARASDEEEAKGIVGSLAETVYGFAWPTAEYESVSFKSLDPVVGGHDVVVRLSGKSAFGDGDLWLDLVFEIRNGAFHDMSVRRHNAILVPPFTTVKTLAQTLAELIEDGGNLQQPRHSAPGLTTRVPEEKREAAAVCLRNPTKYTINLSYRWGENEWTSASLKPGYFNWFSWKYPTKRRVSPQFEVMFDSDMTKGVTNTRRLLSRHVVTIPVSCEAARKYIFVMEANTLGLRSDDWEPGWPHAFYPFVVAGDDETNWRPAPGYRWFDRKDPNNFGVIKNSTGVIGIYLQKGENDRYPLIVKVVPDRPADKAGIRTGMMITKINAASTFEMSLDECVRNIAGPIGTTVDIEVVEKGATQGRIMRIERR